MNDERAAFGPRLRREREARGLTLTAIAQQTKIKASLFAALERNDVSQWPAGIFRRAFMRDYANALGLPAEPIVAEFVRLFPEPGVSVERVNGRTYQNFGGDVRLTLACDGDWRMRQAARHVLAAALDCGAVLLVAALIAWVDGASFWSAAAMVGLGYFSVGTILLGRSVASCWLSGQKVVRGPTRQEPQEESELLSPELVDLITTRAASEALHPQ